MFFTILSSRMISYGRLLIMKNDDFKKLDLFSNIRKCRYCLLLLQKMTGVTAYDDKDLVSCQRAFSKMIEQTNSDRSALLDYLTLACKENIISDDHFLWFVNSERATFWLWGYTAKLNEDARMQGINSFLDKNNYESVGLKTIPSSHKSRVNLIIEYFDRITIEAIQKIPNLHYSGDKLEKLDFIFFLMLKWNEIKNKEVLKWLPDDDNVIQWAWDRLTEEQLVQKKTKKSDIYEPRVTKWFIPANKSERKIALIGAIDLWDDAPDTKKLFLINLNKSWTQRRLRKNREDKKVLNTYLNHETKLKLDNISKMNKMTISDTLEFIINNYHDSLMFKK